MDYINSATRMYKVIKHHKYFRKNKIMKKSVIPKYIKTKVVIDFGNEVQAEAFFKLFDKPAGEKLSGLDLMLKYLSNSTEVSKIENTRELKHNYLIKIV